MKKIILLPLLLVCCISQAQMWISRAKAMEDLRFFYSTLKDVHYDPFTLISQAGFEKKLDSTIATLPDSIERKDLLLKLYQVAAWCGDAHTAPFFLQKWIRPEINKKVLLPFSFTSDDQYRVYALPHPFTDIPKGAHVISVNHINLTDFAKKIQQYYGGLPSYTRAFSERFFSYFLYMEGVRPPFTISFKSGNRNGTLTIDSGASFRQVFGMNFPSLVGPSYTFNIVDNRIGYLNFMAMNGSVDQLDHVLDSAFKTMRIQQIDHFVVDIRNNSGGNSALADLLIAYFNKKDYSLMGYRKWKVSRQYKEYMKKNNSLNPLYAVQPDGTVWKRGSCGPEKPRFVADTIFTGKVYLLTGPFTFSSANLLADGVKTYKLATIVGEATGERENDFGETYSFDLPNSQITMNISTSFDIGTRCNEKANDAIQPDVKIITTAVDKANGIDPVMEYIRREVKK